MSNMLAFCLCLIELLFNDHHRLLTGVKGEFGRKIWFENIHQTTISVANPSCVQADSEIHGLCGGHQSYHG